MSNPVNLVIKGNNTICREECPICGEVGKHADSPYGIFAESCNAGVCPKCIAEYDPHLGEILSAGLEKYYKDLKEKGRQKH